MKGRDFVEAMANEAERRRNEPNAAAERLANERYVIENAANLRAALDRLAEAWRA